jgi:hypothetical protein
MATKRKYTGRRTAGTRPEGAKTFGPAGAMGGKEKQMLAIAAGQAFKHQASLGRVEPGQPFDEWRHEQVRDVVGKDGLRACAHADFRPLLAWFQQLAGLDDKALATRLRSGKVTTGGPADDTREAREAIAHEIRIRLEDHIELADRSWPDLLQIWTDRSRASWQTYGTPGEPWPGLDSKFLAKATLRKEAVEQNGGAIRHGYLVALARQKTRRPDLTFGPDIFAGLADRCTVKQLRDLLSTLVNRINAREGLGETGKRNRKQASPAAKARRSRREIDTPPVFDPFEQLRRDGDA